MEWYLNLSARNKLKTQSTVHAYGLLMDERDIKNALSITNDKALLLLWYYALMDFCRSVISVYCA